MQYVAVLLFIIILGFSGGLSSSSDTTRNSREVSASGFTESDQKINNENRIVTNAKKTNFTQSRQSIKQVPERIETIDLRLPSVITKSIQNIESNSALVQTEVDMRSHKKGIVFVVYGYDKKSVNMVGLNYDDYAKIPKFDSDKVRTKIIDSRPTGLEHYKYRLSSLIENTEYFFQICVQHNTAINIITCGNLNSFTTNLHNTRNNNFRVPQVSLDTAINITAYTAELEGNVSMNDGIDGIAFFIYGESKNLVGSVDKIYSRYTDIDEDDEFLQKIRASVRLLGKSTHNKVIEDLDLNTQYYYRFCVEYDGENSGIKCSSVRSFTTDKRDKDDIPSVITGQVVASGASARISGSVNMRDFNDGLVFFVYGTDNMRVKKVQELNSFNRVRQALDVLQRISVDNDHDGKGSFAKRILYLKSNTDYYYRLCVEYEDEDKNGREKLFLSCGDVNNFHTQ